MKSQKTRILEGKTYDKQKKSTKKRYFFKKTVVMATVLKINKVFEAILP